MHVAFTICALTIAHSHCASEILISENVYYLDVQDLTPPPGWSQPQFIGWTPIERIFVGYRQKAA